LRAVTIDREGPLPIYEQIAAILLDRILDGTIPPGRAVPSETTLQQEYGVARETVRHAVQIIRAKGYIRTVAGRGHWVVDQSEWPDG
jgi:GntR family transcriptional regulator